MLNKKITSVATCACIVLTLSGCSNKADVKANSNYAKKIPAVNSQREKIILDTSLINNETSSSNYNEEEAKVKIFLDTYFKKYYDWGFENADTSTLDDLYAKDSDIIASAISYEYIVGKYEGKVNKYDFSITKVNTKDAKITSLLTKLHINMSIVPPDGGERQNIDFLYALELQPYNDTYQVKTFYLDTTKNVEKQQQDVVEKENKYDNNTKTKDTLTDFTPKDADKKYNITQDGSKKTVEQIIEDNDSKTVAILVPTDKSDYFIGSGFFVAPGIIVTNYHVIDGASDAIIRTNTGKLYEVDGIVSGDKTVDIAIIKLKEKTGEPVEIGDVSKLKKGENAVAIGSPKGLFNTVSTGIISNFWNDGKVSQIQISIPITHGNSGGPLFNATGQVVGINSSGLEGEGELNFAVSCEHIYDIADKIKGENFDSIKSKKLSDVFNKKPVSNLKEFGLNFGVWGE